MSGRRFLGLSIGLTLVLLMLPALLVIVADPYQVYHQPIARPDRFYSNERYQDIGLINSWLNAQDSAFDSIVIGTSMSQNFRMSQLSEAQHLRGTLKLTLAGGRARELAAIAKKALAGNRVKCVIWEIYSGYNRRNYQELHPESPLPLYLYEGTKLDTWRYLLNSDIVMKSLKAYRRRLRSGESASLDNHYAWTQEEQFSAWSNPEHLGKLRRQILATQPLSPVAATTAVRTDYPNVDQNLLPILKAYPQVQFRLFFPPTAYVSLVTSGTSGFWNRMQLQRYVVTATAKLPNVRIFSFDLIDGIGDTISVYKDSSHYRPWVNDYIARGIGDPLYRLTRENFSAYSKTLRGRVNRYRQAVISGGEL